MALGAMSPTQVRALIRIALEVGGAVAAVAVDNLFSGAEKVDTAVEWPIRKVHMVFARTSATGLDEDVAVITFHFVNITDGAVDGTWVDTDFVAVEAALDTFWAAMKTDYSSVTSLSQYRWYRVRPGTTSGPPVRITTRATPGTGAGVMLPPQVAVTATERTRLRKRWGRIYMPAPLSATANANSGLILAAHCTKLATQLRTAYDTCRSSDFEPVVYSARDGRAFPITQIQVDDLYDVIRSRRWSKPSTRALQPAS